MTLHLQSSNNPQPAWLSLGQAAAYLGVHFTTLRRWANAGVVPCLRTPGGQRRFERSELDRFIQSLRQPLPTPALAAMESRVLDAARQTTLTHRSDAWRQRMGDAMSERFRASGRRLVALLMQYSARTENGEPFLLEGRRMAADYGALCHRSNLTITDTIEVFLLFRRSVLDAVHDAGSLGGGADVDGQRLYRRMSDFMDALLVATAEGFCRDQAGQHNLVRERNA